MKNILRFFSILCLFFFKSFILYSAVELKPYKILLLGERNSGKTSFLRAVAGEDFQQTSYPSVGIDLRKVSIIDCPEHVSYFVYDVSSYGESQKILLRDFAKSVDGFIILYDVGNVRSLETIHFWKELIAGRPSVLIANKVDQKKSRVISREDGEGFAHALESSYFEVSIKANLNIKKSLESLESQLLLKASNL